MRLCRRPDRQRRPCGQGEKARISGLCARQCFSRNGHEESQAQVASALRGPISLKGPMTIEISCTPAALEPEEDLKELSRRCALLFCF